MNPEMNLEMNTVFCPSPRRVFDTPEMRCMSPSHPASSMSSIASIHSLPYEVLSRDDGAAAAREEVRRAA